MAGRIILGIANPALDANGDVDSGATLTFYKAGTTTLQTVCTDSSLGTPLANPLSPDSAGRFPQIWADDSYSFDVKWTPSGASPITYSNINPVSTAAISVKLFGAKGDGSTDDTAAFTAAISYCQTNGRTLFVPASSGQYIIASNSGLTANAISIHFEKGASISYTGNGTCLTFTGGGYCSLENITIGSTTGAIGLLLSGLTGQTSIYNLQIYPFSAGVALKIKQSFNINFFSGFTRNCSTYHIDTDNSAAAGSNYANVCNFYGFKFQQDSGALTAMVNWRAGSQILFSALEAVNSGSACVFMDLGNDTIGSGDQAAGQITIDRPQLEGSFSDLFRIGNGTYTGTPPHDIVIRDISYTSGSATNGINVINCGGLRIEQNNWFTVSGKYYIIGADVSNGIIVEGSFNSSNITVDDSATNLIFINDAQVIAPIFGTGAYPNALNQRRVAVPSTDTSSGQIGDWAVDSGYFYWAIGSNSWRRAAGSTW